MEFFILLDFEPGYIPGEENVLQIISLGLTVYFLLARTESDQNECRNLDLIDLAFLL